MKLTNKDKEFLAELWKLLEQHSYEVTLKTDGRSRMVLRSKYGNGPGRHLNLTRQGVYWRFDHIFNQAYVSAYETVYWLESNFGPSLRENALAIARERVAMRKKAMETGIQRADPVIPRRQTEDSPPE